MFQDDGTLFCGFDRNGFSRSFLLFGCQGFGRQRCASSPGQNTHWRIGCQLLLLLLFTFAPHERQFRVQMFLRNEGYCSLVCVCLCTTCCMSMCTTHSEYVCWGMLAVFCTSDRDAMPTIIVRHCVNESQFSHAIFLFDSSFP